MTNADMLSNQCVCGPTATFRASVEALGAMFGLEIKRGRRPARQYRARMSVLLERIKELVEQAGPTSQIRPRLEAEGLVSPKLIGLPMAPGNPEVI